MNFFTDWPIVSFIALIIGFGFLIFIHELGHFAVAKWVGIRCTQFAIGFGQSLLTYRKGIGFRVGTTEGVYEKRAIAHLDQKHATPHPGEHQSVAQYDDFTKTESRPGKYTPQQVHEAADELGLGETEYRLNWMPLGGYVKMLGQEDLDPNARSGDPRSFNNKSIGARAAVISAGVVMNTITGLIFFIIAFSIGVDFPSATVGATLPGSPAATTYASGHDGDPAYFGLRPGDRIVEINDKPIRDLTGVKIATALGGEGEPLHFEIDRPGQDGELSYTLVASRPTGERLLSVGIIPTAGLTVSAVIKDSTASKAGVKGGMKVSAVEGEPVSTYAQFVDAVDAQHGRPVAVTFVDPQTQATVEAQLTAEPLLVRPDYDTPSNLLGLVPAVEIGPSEPDSPAAKAGVQEGDLLARLGGVDWPAMDEVRKIVLDASGPLDLTVFREGKLVALEPVEPNYKGLIGISLAPFLDQPVIGKTLPGSPAASLDIVGGSKLLSLNDQPIADWGAFQRLLVELPEGPQSISLGLELNLASTPTESVTLDLNEANRQTLAYARWSAPGGVMFLTKQATVVANNPIHAMGLGLEYTGEFIIQTYVTLRRLIEGSVSVRDLRGPAGIVDEGTKAAERGWPYYWFFLGLISVNLAVINFLPIPIVDGGHIVFLIIEKIKGSPASPAIQMGAMWIGLALIGAIFLVVTYNDIARIFFGIS